MLRTWNAENINQVGPTQRSGSKGFKALGDAGEGRTLVSWTRGVPLVIRLRPIEQICLGHTAAARSQSPMTAVGRKIPPSLYCTEFEARALSVQV